MKHLILVFLIIIMTLNVHAQMTQDYKFYKDKWNGMYLFNNPKQIITSRYDFNTKELCTGGIAYKELIEFNQFGYCILHKLYYNQPKKTESEYSFCYNDTVLVEEKEIHGVIKYITEYNYLISGLLDYKLKFRLEENKNNFWEGIKYEYSNINNIPKMIKSISISSISNDSLIYGDSSIYEYDNEGKLTKEISPTNMHDSNFDYNSKTMLSYYYDNDVVKIVKTYTNTRISDTNFKRQIGELSYWASTYEMAGKMTFDNIKNILWREGDFYKYDFDSCGNWIVKYRSGVKIEERVIKY